MTPIYQDFGLEKLRGDEEELTVKSLLNLVCLVLLCLHFINQFSFSEMMKNSMFMVSSDDCVSSILMFTPTIFAAVRFVLFKAERTIKLQFVVIDMLTTFEWFFFITTNCGCRCLPSSGLFVCYC